MKRFPLVCTTAALAIAIGAAIFYLSSPSTPGLGSASDGLAASFSDQTRSGGNGSGSAGSDEHKVPSGIPTADDHPSQTEQVAPENYSSNDPQQPWEKDIIAFADRLDIPDTAKAEQLLNRIGSLPPEGKVLAMEFATKLIPDEEYLRFRPRIFSLVSSDDLRETVLLDALTRGETLRMPTLVEMLRQPPNPAQAEVREILLAYLDTDYGSDTKQWDAAVQKFLADHPDL